MLDFYLIPDEAQTPDDPEQMLLEFIGQLHEKTFAQLKTKKVIPDHPYTDFRWKKPLIQQIRETLQQKHLHTDTDAEQLLGLLNIAEQQQLGIIGYWD